MITKGLHHVAYRCINAQETVDFYTKVLDMPYAMAMAEDHVPSTHEPDPYMHIFFDIGDGSFLAFFEIPKGAEEQTNRNALGGMQHVAFVVTAEKFKEIEQRLDAHGIERTDAIPQLPGLLGIYFYDPNGIRMEMACQPDDGEAPDVLACNTQTKAQARAELETLDADAAWIDRVLAPLAD